MKNEIVYILKLAEFRRKAYLAMVKQFQDGEAKYKSQGRLVECDLIIDQLNQLLQAGHICSHENGGFTDEGWYCEDCLKIVSV
jgi:hypothetical protein